MNVSHICHARDSKSRGKKLHSDGIFCSAVTVIYTLFTAVFETPLSMPLIGEGRKVTICDWWNAERQGMNLLRLHMDDLIECSLAYNGIFTVCKIVGTHYGDTCKWEFYEIVYMQQKNREKQGQGDIECTQTLKTAYQLDDSLHYDVQWGTSALMLSTHFALGCLQSLCEFNVPLLFGILARRAIFRSL